MLLCAPTSSGRLRYGLSVGQWSWEDGEADVQKQPLSLALWEARRRGGEFGIVVRFAGWNGLSAESEGYLLGGILPINGSGDDASSETSTFACGVEPRDEGMGVGHSVTWDAHRGGGA